MPGLIGSAEILVMPRFGPGFTNALRRGTRDVTATFARDFQQGVAAALVVAGIAVTKFAATYEKTINRVRTLTNTTEKEISEFNKAIAGLSKSTGVGPDKLVESLYFIQSAGLKASDGMTAAEKSMSVLTQTARLAAIGMGDTQTIAQTLTSVMNAYAGSNQTAAATANTLVAALKEGKTEVEGFSSSLDKVLGVASKLGVEFDQVAAFVAKISQTGASASEATTQLSGLFQSVLQLQRLNLPKQQREALAVLNVDPHKLKEQFDADLAGALKGLEEASKAATKAGNDGEAALASLIPNVRALRGLLGANLGDGFTDIVDKMNAAQAGVGETYRDLLKVHDSFEQQLNRVISGVKVFALQLGENLLPQVVEFAKTLKPIGEALLFLVGGALQAAVSFKAIIAPLVALNVGLKILQGFGITRGAGVFQVLAAGAQALPSLLSTAATHLGNLRLALIAAHNGAGIFNTAMATVGTALGTLRAAVQRALSGAGSGILSGIRSLYLALGAAGPVVAGMTAIAAVAGGIWLVNHRKAQQASKEFRVEVKKVTDALVEGKSPMEAYADNMNKLIEKNEIVREAFQKAGISLEAFNNSLVGGTDNEFKNKIAVQKAELKSLEKQLESTQKLTVKGFFRLKNPFSGDDYTAEQKALLKRIEAQKQAISEIQRLREVDIEGARAYILELVKSGNQLKGISYDTIISSLKGTGDEYVRLTKFIAVANDTTLTATQRYDQLWKILEAGRDDQRGLAQWVKDLPDAFKKADKSLSSFESQLKTTFNGIAGVAGGGGFGDLFSTVLGLKTADTDVQNAKDKLSKAQKALSDFGRTNKQNELQRTVDAQNRAKAIREADDKITNAKNDVVSAKEKVTEDKETLRLAKYALTVDAVTKIMEAELSLSQARTATKQAVLDQVVAENNLISMREEGVRATDDLNKAQRELASKQDDIRKALNAVTSAENDYTNKQYDLVKASRAIEDAQFAVKEKILDVEKAQHDAANAAFDLKNKQAESAGIALQLAKAQQSVVDATLGIASAQFDVVKSVQDIASAQLAVRSSTADIVAIQRDQRNAYDDVATKAKSLSQAQSDLNDVIAKTGSNSREALDAINALRDAQLGVKTSTLDVADAQDKLTAARKALAAGVEGKTRDELLRDVQRAEIQLQTTKNQLNDARQSVNDKRTAISELPLSQAKQRVAAMDAVTKAQKEYSDQQFNASQFSLKIADAQLKLRASVLGVTEAQLKQREAVNNVSKSQLSLEDAYVGVADAQQAQLKFVQELADLSFKLVTADFDVVKAKKEVKDATNAVADAQHDQIVAQQEVVDAANKVVDANRAVIDAQNGVLDHLISIRDAQDAVNKGQRDYAVAVQQSVIDQDKLVQARDAELLAVRNLAGAKDDVVTKQNAVNAANAQLIKDSAAVEAAEKRVKDAISDKALTIAQAALDEIKAEKDKTADLISLKNDVSDAEETLLQKKMARDKAQLEAAYLYPGLNGGKKLTESEYISLLMTLNKAYADQIKGLDPQIKAGINEITIGALGNLDADRMKNNFQSALSKIKGLTLEVDMVITDKGNLAIVLGNSVGVAAKKEISDITSNIFTGSNRWAGGFVAPGRTYTVNELGPEGFWNANTNSVSTIPGGQRRMQFNAPGYVIPAANGGYNDYSDRSTNNYNIETTVTDPEMVARQIERNRRQSLRRSNR